MNWMNWKLWSAVSGTIAALGTLFTYLPYAKSENLFPYSQHASISIDSPREGYQVSADFQVEFSGDLAESDHIWIAAVDALHNWYPLAVATSDGSGRWRATIRREQIVSPVSLCVVKADDKAADSLHAFITSETQARGLNALPSGSEQMGCKNIQPAAG